MRRRLTTALVAAVTGVSLLLAGCTGTEDADEGTTAEGMIGFLNFGDFGGGTMPQENYNPFLDASELAAVHYIYESLLVMNTYACEEVPWLATSYEWTTPRTLVFDIRDGVTWNDGERRELHGRGRGLHVQHDQAVRRPRRAGHVDDPRVGGSHRRQPGHLHLQAA
jgi:peptide/nickel transport system substrate-binding protein